MSDLSDLQFEARDIREQISYHRHHAEPCIWDNTKLESRLGNIQKKLKPLLCQAGVELCRSLVKASSISIVCGPHWKEFEKEKNFDAFDYCKKETNLVFAIKTQLSEVDSKFDDWIKIQCYFEHPYAGGVNLKSPILRFQSSGNEVTLVPSVSFGNFGFNGVSWVGDLNGVHFILNLLYQKQELIEADLVGSLNYDSVNGSIGSD